ncbi:hypothetical protein [Microbacterium oxydans]|uniref:hypothetical protein n=1 Tax=Microbacterium oxydans TaxID=82380 RepID=UPI0024AD5945|nr:hypothetical protein [Microbacterium oxydans]
MDEEDHSSPNPVLENVLGLLLCYDELVFLARQFCPADLRELPYVRFLTDDADMSAAAGRAIAAYESAERDDWEEYPSFDQFAEISEQMQGEERERFAIDNHTHGLRIGGEAVTGNAMRLDNAVCDLWIAAELGLDRSDVIFSSPAQQALSRQLEPEVVDGQYFGHEKRVAATQLVSLQVPNFLGPTGSYHEALEGIRDRRDVAEFRQFLLEFDAPIKDGITLADEISRAAFDVSDELSRRYLAPKGFFRSIGVPVVRGTVNMVMPGLGNAAALAIEAPHQIGERQFKTRARWAPFIVALNAPRRA